MTHSWTTFSVGGDLEVRRLGFTGCSSGIGRCVTDGGPAPLRLTPGTDAYQAIRGALSNRLAALTAQRPLPSSTDSDGPLRRARA